MTKTPTKTVADLAREIANQQPDQKPEADFPEVAAVPSEPSREAMLAALAEKYGTTPQAVADMLGVNKGLPEARARPDTEPADPGGPRVPVLLNRDYWAPAYLGDVNADGNRRVAAGAILHLPVVEAKRLIKAGVATRADAFPGDDE